MDGSRMEIRVGLVDRVDPSSVTIFDRLLMSWIQRLGRRSLLALSKTRSMAITSHESGWEGTSYPFPTHRKDRFKKSSPMNVLAWTHSKVKSFHQRTCWKSFALSNE